MNIATRQNAAPAPIDTGEDVDSRARYYMQIWADWWQRDDNPRLSFPKRVPILATGGGWDTQEQYDTLDNAAAEATDAALQDLDVTFRLVLQNTYNAAVLRYRRLIITDLLSAAHSALYRRLRTRGFD